MHVALRVTSFLGKGEVINNRIVNVMPRENPFNMKVETIAVAIHGTSYFEIKANQVCMRLTQTEIVWLRDRLNEWLDEQGESKFRDDGAWRL